MISQLSRLSQKHKIKHFLRELQLLLTTQWLFGIWENTKKPKKNPPRLLSSAPHPFSMSCLSFTPRGVGGIGGSEMLLRELAMGGVWRHAGSLAGIINGIWAFWGICLCCSTGICANAQQLETGDLFPAPSPCQLLFAFCCPPAQSISPPLLHDCLDLHFQQIH